MGMWDVQLKLRDMLTPIRASPDLHTSATTSNVLSLLLAPINSYQSALTLLAIPNYSPLLAQQTFATRRTIATAIVSSILKNEAALESPEDVAGILDLCHVLVRDQADVGVGVSSVGGRAFKQDAASLQEEQGWIARMIHLLRADSLDIQHEVSTCRGSLTPGTIWHRYSCQSVIAAADCSTIFRRRRRAHSLHLPASNYCVHKSRTPIQREANPGMHRHGRGFPERYLLWLHCRRKIGLTKLPLCCDQSIKRYQR